MISQRPAEAADRAVPGHWEGDLIIGTGARRSAPWSSAPAASPCCCTCRRARPYGPAVKNGPALDRHGAEAVRDAIAARSATLPEHLRRSLTWDQGTEMAQHARLRIDTGLQSTSATRTAPGSAAPTRTPTGCCASTSPRAPTSPATAPTTWPPSPTSSTAARARRSAGAPRPKCSTSTSPQPRPNAFSGPTNRSTFQPPGRGPRGVARATIAAAASPYGLRPPRRQPRPHNGPACADPAQAVGPQSSTFTRKNTLLRRPLESGQTRRIDCTARR